MKPNLEDMQVFLEVVEARSFTAAAERLGRTKSAVSQSVSRLESDLGSRLLHRSTRSLSLTDAGTRFFAHCRDIRLSYDTALSEVTSAEAEPAGTLSLTAPNALCGPVIVPAIARFAGRYPGVSVRLRADDSPADLIESQIDLAVRVGDPNVQSAKIAKLGMLHESLYASPDCVALRGGSPKNFAEIADWDHIANDWQGIPVKYQTPSGEPIRVTPRIRCNSFHEIFDLAEKGVGVARLPDIAAMESALKGTLVRLFDVGSTPVYSMHLFAKKPPAKVRAIVQLIRDNIKLRQLRAT